MPRIGWMLLLLVVTGSPVAVAAAGGDALGEPFTLSAEELLALSREAAATAVEAPGYLLLRHTLFRFDEEGRCSVRRWRILHVRRLEDLPVREREIRSGWNAWYDDRPLLRARVLLPDGRVLEVDTDVLEGEGAAEEGGPLRAILPGLVDGCVVETVVRTRQDRTALPEATVRREYLETDLPCRRLVVALEHPRALELKTAFHRRPDGMRERYQARGSTVRRRWEWRNRPPLARQDYLRSWRRGEMARLDVGTGRTWSAVGEAYQTRLDLLNRDFSPPAWLASLAEVDGSRARIVALLEQIQDRVRATEDFVGPTTLFPVPPGRVLEAGEGDCLDRANLLTVLLAQLGLEARVALLRIAGRPDVSPDVPGISLFDHALVRVDLEEPLWVETALPPERVGELPVVCRGRRVLVVRGPGSRLLRTPGGGSGGSP